MKLSFSHKAIDNLRKGLTAFKDPLSKQLIYRSLYDSCRDCKISAIEFLDIILDQISLETNDNIISSLLRYLNAIIRAFIPLKYYQSYKHKAYEA